MGGLQGLVPRTPASPVKDNSHTCMHTHGKDADSLDVAQWLRHPQIEAPPPPGLHGQVPGASILKVGHRAGFFPLPPRFLTSCLVATYVVTIQNYRAQTLVKSGGKHRLELPYRSHPCFSSLPPTIIIITTKLELFTFSLITN